MHLVLQLLRCFDLNPAPRLFFFCFPTRQDARGFGSDALDTAVATTLLPSGSCDGSFAKGVHHPPGLGQGPGQGGDRLVSDTCTTVGGGGFMADGHDPPPSQAVGGGGGGGGGSTPEERNGRIFSSSSAGYSEAPSLKRRSSISKGKTIFPKIGAAVTDVGGRGQGAGTDDSRGGKTVPSPGRIPPPGAVTLATPRVKRVRLKVSGACGLGRVGQFNHLETVESEKYDGSDDPVFVFLRGDILQQSEASVVSDFKVRSHALVVVQANLVSS